MGLLQPTHLIIIAVIALLVVGPKRLPEMAKSLGGGMREFKNSVTGDDEDEKPAVTAAEKKQDPEAAKV